MEDIKKTYKDFETEFIGESDIATLILVGYEDENGLKLEELSFGEDGDYRAYIVYGLDVEIGSHYRKVATFKHWLKIYDDTEKTFHRHAKEFNIYRAGEFGCIIQIVE